MEGFFNRANLTPEQQARWDDAMAQYHRIQEENLRRKVASMSAEDKEAYLASIRHSNPDASNDVLEHLRAETNPLGGAAGDSHSALFARLLDGKKPLPHPPPTSNAYPWYAVVEDEGSFPVVVGNVISFPGGGAASFAVSINQCAWQVLSMNSAAKALIALNQELAKTSRRERSGADRFAMTTRYTWSEQFLDEVFSAYASGPEFMVKHGPWPSFQLELGLHEVECPRHFAEECVAGNHRAKLLANSGSVFDTESLCMNGAIVSLDQAAGDTVKLAYDGWVLEKI